MSQNSASVNVYLKTPEGLVFEGETNNDGKLVLTFERKELLLESDFEIGLDSYSIDTAKMYNVLDGQSAFFVSSSNVQTEKDWPPCKLSTVLQVLKSIEEMNLGIVMDFSHPFSHSIDLKQGKLSIPLLVGCALGLVTSENKPSPLVEILNVSQSIDVEAINNEKYISVTPSSTAKFHFPVVYDKNIWNIISTNSFQSLYFYSDLVVDELISGVRIPLLGIFPFRELDETNTWREDEPIWRRVDRKNR